MSWSGARSKAAAELLYDWIKCVVQASRPWISTRGIGRGSVWFAEINNELKDTSVGIICLTHQNKNSPWILFEAGALAKGLTTNKVCTFLVDLSPADIQDPLAQFNHTMPTRDGMLSMVATLNSALDAPLDGPTMLSVFETFWPKFEANFAELLKKYPQEVEIEVRSNDSMLEEILETTRGLTHKIRDIEQQIGYRENQIGTKIVSSGSYSPPPNMSISDAIRLVHNGVAGGISYDEVHARLMKAGFGKKTAKEIMEIAIENYRPDGPVVPT